MTDTSRKTGRRTFRRALTRVVLASLASLALMTPPALGVSGFGDVGGDEFYTSGVQWMVDEEITTGTSAICFSPTDDVTRGQAAAFLWRMEGEPAPSRPHEFLDVTAIWQQGAVSWLAQTGITTGTSAFAFSPERALTRGEFAALLWRLAGEPSGAALHNFTDVIAPWQEAPVSWLLGAAITTGTTASKFSPDQSISRGEVATFLYRYQGEPPVLVDLTHPSDPMCEDQVESPERARFTFDQVCDYVGSAPDDAIVFPDQPGASHLHDFFGVLMLAEDDYAVLRATGSSCADEPDNRSSYWVPAAYDGAGVQILPERITAYYRGGNGSRFVEPFTPETRMVTEEAFFIDEPSDGAAQLFVRFPDCGNGEVDSPDHRSHMAFADDSGNCPETHPVQMPRITFRVTYPRVPVTMSSGPLTSVHADFFYGWDPTALEERVDRCLNEGRDLNVANQEFCRG